MIEGHFKPYGFWFPYRFYKMKELALLRIILTYIVQLLWIQASCYLFTVQPVDRERICECTAVVNDTAENKDFWREIEVNNLWGGCGTKEGSFEQKRVWRSRNTFLKRNSSNLEKEQI